MPYADPEKQREARARWYRNRYNSDTRFAALEARRKADWLQTDDGKASNAAASSRARAMRRRAHLVTRWLVTS
jgi:hypothetical protein